MQESSLFLIALMGPVGSGKSYIARILSSKLNAVQVRTDDIRVELRSQEKSYSRAYTIARLHTQQALGQKKSVIADFDAVLSKRREELRKMAQKFSARFVLIHIKTPEKLILQRLRSHKYTSRDLFKNANQAIRVYFIRKKFHTQKLKIHPDFVINNTQLLKPQLTNVLKKLKGPIA